MEKDGTMGIAAGVYRGQDRFDCRQNLWKDMEEAVSFAAAGARGNVTCTRSDVPWTRVKEGRGGIKAPCYCTRCRESSALRQALVKECKSFCGDGPGV